MKCIACHGSGTTHQQLGFGRDLEWIESPCRACRGSGYSDEVHEQKGERSVPVLRTALMLDAREDCVACGKKDQMFRLRDGLPRCSNCDALHPNAGADAIAKFDAHSQSCPRCTAVADGAPGPLCKLGEEIRKGSLSASTSSSPRAVVVPFPGGAR